MPRALIVRNQENVVNQWPFGQRCELSVALIICSNPNAPSTLLLDIAYYITLQ